MCDIAPPGVQGWGHVRGWALWARQLRLTRTLASTYVDGMSQGIAEAASGADPATGLQAARELRELAERLEALQVDNARNNAWSWDEIAFSLCVRQRAWHKQYASANGPQW